MNDSITIRIRFFALLRDRAGVDQLSIQFATGTTVAQAVAELNRRFPAAFDAVRRVMHAVNQDYATPTTVLQDGDELALIPPVSGG